MATDSVTVQYVYDCGAQKKYKSTLEREIDEYVRRQEGPVDLLYLSHFDFDHVSGLPYLLDRRAVRTVVMPFMDSAERVMALGRYAYETHLAAGAVPDWYLQVLVDPVRYFQDRDCRVVQVVNDDIPSEPPNDSPPLEPSPFRSPDPGVRDRRGATGSISSTPGVEVWIWLPWVLAVARRTSGEFRTRLAEELHLAVTDVDHLISDVGSLQLLLRYRPDAFRKAYRRCAHSGDRNVTSLFLYSGPPQPALFDRRWLREGSQLSMRAAAVPAAWLGTGDAPLKANQRAVDFSQAFRTLMPAVGVFALPHHGSDRSHNELVLDGLSASAHAVVSADKYSNWRHPGSAVIRAAAIRTAGLVLVTSKQGSRWTDHFRG